MPNSRRTACENEALVTDLLLANTRPQSAYRLVEAARERGVRLHPMQVYRTLNRLIEKGAALRIDALNAFVRRANDDALILVCRNCGSAASVADEGLRSAARRVATALGFQPEAEPLELAGRCGSCQA